MFDRAPGTSPRPTPSTSSTSTFVTALSQFDNGSTGHPFFSPSSFQQPHITDGAPGEPKKGLVGVAPGRPYPSLERSARDNVSISGEINNVEGNIGSGNAQSGGVGAFGTRQPSPTPIGSGSSARGAGGVGAIGDRRKLTPSPSPEKKQTFEGSLSLGTGGLSTSMDDYPSSNPNSRPSSFILDVLPARSPRLSTSPGAMESFPLSSTTPTDENVLAGLAHSSLFHSPSKPANNIATSRTSSPGPSPELFNKRLEGLENGLRELNGMVHGELRTLKEQLAMLSSLVLGGNNPSTIESGNPLTMPGNEGGRALGNGLYGLESPMLTVRSPSPHRSPHQQLPQQPHPLRPSNSQASLSYLNLPNSPTPSSFIEDASSASSANKDEQIKSLTLQMSALSHTVSQLMGGGGVVPTANPQLTSPLLGAGPPNNHGNLRQHSLPPLGGLGLTSPAMNGGSPNLVASMESWKREGAGMGLGVSTPRSPLIRPSSANSLNRQSSIGSRFAGNGGNDDERKRSGLSYGAVGQGGGNYDNGSTWTDGAPNGMTSPLIGGGASNNAPGSLGSKWEALGVGSDLFRTIAKYGLGPPTKIQAKAIPCVLRAQDIVAQAPSIQERIQSYVVPAIQTIHTSNQLDPNSASKGIQVIIVTATVDQAAQAQRLSVGLGGGLGIRTSLCVGSSSNATDMQNELGNLRKSTPHVLVGTPQKLLEMLNLRSLNINDVKLLIIDECDQLIARNLSDFVANMVRLLPPSGTGVPPTSPSLSRSPLLGGGGGSATPSIRSLPGAFDTPNFASSPRFPSNASVPSLNSQNQQQQVEEGRQTVIFSCTVPQDVLNFASSLQLKEPVRVLVRREGGDNSSPSVRGLRQYYLYIAMGPNVQNGIKIVGAGTGRRDGTNSREWKLEALADLCEDYPFESCVIFCSSVDAVEAVSYKLGTRSLEALALHQDMGQAARHSIMSKFRAPASRGATKRALVVYDALCRTLTDVHQVSLVINYDLPRSVEDYVHRIACATASGYGKPGSVINIVTPGGDVDMLRAIEGFYRCKIAELPTSFANV